MRVLLDNLTGELVEVVPEATLPLVPYSYREAKAAAMRASLERREAEGEYEKAVRELAHAERGYRVELAKRVVYEKATGTSTTAEVLAKGDDTVAAARERLTLADGMRYVALERIKRSDADRTSLSQLIAWSRAVATGPWGERDG